jgi:pantetheine-phosphate adenylyltransferase
MNERVGIFPGSFDPITKGHESIIKKSALMVDKLIIGIGRNSTKQYLFPIDTRKNWIETTFAKFSNISVMTYDGLTVDFASSVNAKYIFRGLRSGVDFEFEKPIAETNSILNPNIETVFLLADKNFGMISSSIVREIIRNKGNIEKLVPKCVKTQL